jgi:hypothetical protein
MMTQIHPRYFITEKARFEVANLLLRLETEHNLTYGEIVQILSGEIVSVARYMIRSERHPKNKNKKGDEL